LNCQHTQTSSAEHDSKNSIDADAACAVASLFAASNVPWSPLSAVKKQPSQALIVLA